MKQIKLFLTLAAGALFFVSCSDDDANRESTPLGSYDYGVLILNEGNYDRGNASVSYLSQDFSVAQNNIFSIVNNNLPLGDVAQSIGFYGDLAYIIVNNSRKIEVVNRYTFQKVTTITENINNPRYIAFDSGKGYVTNWGDPANPNDDYVAIIDLATQTFKSAIPVAEGPEQIVSNNGRLYVSHSGGYNYGNTVSVISNDAFLTPITVGDVPDDLYVIANDLWVNCKGNSIYAPGGATKGKFVKVNLLNNTVVGGIEYGSGSSIVNLENSAISNGFLYYNIGADVYKTSLSATILPDTPIFNVSSQGTNSIYGFAVYQNRIYISDASGFTAAGKVHVYESGDNDTVAGTFLKTTTVGVGPSAFYFNF